MARTPITTADLTFAVAELTTTVTPFDTAEQIRSRDRVIDWLKEEITTREVSAIIDQLAAEKGLSRTEARPHARALHKSGYRA